MQKVAERPSQAFHFGVLKEMDELLERTLVTAERVGGIEVRQTLAADRTEVVLVKRIVIREGSSAGAAEKFGLKRLR